MELHGLQSWFLMSLWRHLAEPGLPAEAGGSGRRILAKARSGNKQGSFFMGNHLTYEFSVA